MHYLNNFVVFIKLLSTVTTTKSTKNGVDVQAMR